jgi:hypothetical protein
MMAFAQTNIEKISVSTARIDEDNCDNLAMAKKFYSDSKSLKVMARISTLFLPGMLIAVSVNGSKL